MKDKHGPEYQHALITGVTMTGKTTLAHCMANEEDAKKKDKRKIIVYDPVGTETAAGTWPDGTIFFDDEQKFIRYMSKFSGSDAIVFVDEADDVFAHNAQGIENTKIIRRGRHFGWQIVLITQRPHLICPSARSQCGVCCVFRLSQADANSIGKDFGHSDIHKVALDQGDFLVLRSGQAKIERANIFKSIGKDHLKWTESDTGSKSRR